MTKSMPPPSSLDLRAQLESLARNDLLGPAGAPEEIVDDRSVRGRYVLGLLAPKGQSALPQACERYCQAARRRVAVDICLETADASEGKVAYDMFAALGAEIRRHARLFVWPLDQRPVSPSGHHGSLHAKVAVADGRALLISSANLTEFAMTLNMEMGMLVWGGEWPARVEQHFDRLMQAGVLDLVSG